LFERNEGSTYFYFGEIPNSLPPPPFGELEDVYYAGGLNPISFQVLSQILSAMSKSNFQFNHLLFSFPFSSFLVSILNIEAKVEYKTLCLVP
jgi:hypothetical protein